MSARDKLRHLVEDLPEESLPSALRMLESLHSEEASLGRLLASPEGDEPLTTEEESRQGKVRPWAAIRDSLA